MLDILLDPLTGDVLIENGDFVIGVSDNQNKALLLKLPKGAVKKEPIATVGVINYLESEDGAGLIRDVKQSFAGDGMAVKSVTITTEGKLNVDAKY